MILTTAFLLSSLTAYAHEYSHPLYFINFFSHPFPLLHIPSNVHYFENSLVHSYISSNTPLLFPTIRYIPLCTLLSGRTAPRGQRAIGRYYLRKGMTCPCRQEN